MRTYSWTSRRADFSHSTERPATLALAPDQAQISAAQLFDAIAEQCCLLELQVGRRRFHLRSQVRDMSLELTMGAERVLLVPRDRDVVPLVDAAHHLVDAFHD